MSIRVTMDFVENRDRHSHGSVEHLFIKPDDGRDRTGIPRGRSLSCVQGFGIAGDFYANRLSPRQVLVTLASELESLALRPGDLLENIVISLSSADHFRPGAALITSGGVEIKLTMYCEPCPRIAPLVTSLRALINRRGILGYIVNGGTITAGDSIYLVPDKYVPLAESPAQKFLDFIATVPAGKVVRYADVTLGMGVADNFVRAVPGYIRRHMHHSIPVHRIVNGKGQLLEYIPDQARRLALEGVRIAPPDERVGARVASVDLSTFLGRG